ncbi:MAG: 5'-nucleotidase C-terminal domain-containing protein [Acidimicrobiales bacterium]
MTQTFPDLWKRALAAVTAAALIAAVFAIANTQSADAADGDFSVTVLHHNDGESKLVKDVEGGFPGVASFIAYLNYLQSSATTDGLVTVTSGDNLLASPSLSVSQQAGPPYFDSIALSYGNYDAMAIGNHEFDFGPDDLAAFIGGFSDTSFPFLSANLDVSGEPSLAALAASGRIAKSTMVMTGGEYVGIIGATTPELPNISSPRNVMVDAVVPAIQAEVAKLEAAGVNKIILIAHLQSVAEDIALVPMLEGIDVAIAGGGDDNLRNEGDTCVIDEEPAGPYPLLASDSTGATVPIVTGPGGYRCIGELELHFDGDGVLTGWSGESILVPVDFPGNAAIVNDVILPLTDALADLSANTLAVSQVDLDGRRSSVRGMQANEGSLLADALLWQATQVAADFGVPVPDLAVQNGGGIRNDSILPAGPFSELDSFSVAPFANFVTVVTVPREVVKLAFEQAYDNLPEIDGQFAQVSDTVSLFVDPNQPAREINRDGACELVGNEGSRVRDLVIGGEAIVTDGQVVPGPDVTIATIDFLARGGDCYPFGDYESTALGVSYQAALANYVSEGLGGVISAADYPLGATDRINTEEFTGVIDDGGDDGDSGGDNGGGGGGPAFAG